MKCTVCNSVLLLFCIQLLLKNHHHHRGGVVSAFLPVVASHAPVPSAVSVPVVGVLSHKQNNVFISQRRKRRNTEQDNIQNYALRIRAGGGEEGEPSSSSSSGLEMCSTPMNEDASDIVIVKVTCSPTEPAALRQGVTELFKLYFDELYELGCDLGFQGFQSEWVDLPGKYDFNKSGGLFVAIDKSSSSSSGESLDHNAISSKNVVGCIAIRPLEGECGEVKRMYIRKSHRRKGIGNLLAEAIISHAWATGYTEIKLDSLERLVGAVKLYEQLGFQRIPAYCECPEADHVCMNLFK
mmetsp:Transcript_22591/g.34708  ORF Transcript_22591/g.34708 Transcript_22591/m.34708 type:complete len:296 (-) Transcript_22591:244-1131(-)